MSEQWIVDRARAYIIRGDFAAGMRTTPAHVNLGSFADGQSTASEWTIRMVAIASSETQAPTEGQ